MCKASLIFKSNLELDLSIILKERELYESKHAVVECKCLKMRLAIDFDIFLNPSFKMTISFANAARTMNLYTRKGFKSSGIGSLYEK